MSEKIDYCGSQFTTYAPYCFLRLETGERKGERHDNPLRATVDVFDEIYDGATCSWVPITPEVLARFPASEAAQAALQSGATVCFSTTTGTQDHQILPREQLPANFVGFEYSTSDGASVWVQVDELAVSPAWNGGLPLSVNEHFQL